MPVYMEADRRASAQAQVVPQCGLDANEFDSSSIPSVVHPRLGHVKLDDINAAPISPSSAWCVPWYSFMLLTLTDTPGGRRSLPLLP
eukprot:1921455-Amphidinium_carterae.1